MSLGGGVYTVQNKILGGAYFKFSSVPAATAVIADRGVVAMGIEVPWGAETINITAEDFMTNSFEIFGLDYSAPELADIRDIFCHSREAHLYRLNAGGERATSALATAKCAGTLGNRIKYVVLDNDDGSFDVSLFVGDTKVFVKTVEAVSELPENPFVTWNSVELEATAGTSLAGGTDSVVNSGNHQTFLGTLERYTDTNAVCYSGTDSAIKKLYAQWAVNMREAVGYRLQAVLFNYQADNYTVVNVKNSAAVVPWVAGVIAGTACNKSATNLTYDGEAVVPVDYTQKQLEAALKAGEFTLHAVGDEVRVLEDINSLVSLTDEQGAIFQDNQTVRTIDTIADSVAAVFATKYLGKVPNDKAGRVSLWGDIVRIHQQLADIRAIEDFEPEDIRVEQGETKKSVVVSSGFTEVNAMVRLYMNTVIE